MKKRILSIATAIVMAITAVCMIGLEPSLAASKSSTYESVSLDVPKSAQEKVGGYYFWMEEKTNGNGETIKAMLKCGKSKSKGGKTLAKAEWFGSNIVTNGKTVYYSVQHFSGSKSTLYQITRTKAKPKKLKTVGKSNGLYLGTCYGKKLYFDRLDSFNDFDTYHHYSYDLTKKTMKEENFGRVGEVPYGFTNSGYGKYLVGSALSTTVNYNGGYPQFLYDLSAKKLVALPNASDSATDGEKVYLYKSPESADQEYGTHVIKSCSLSGKGVKTIKTIKKAKLISFGKKTAYFQKKGSKKMIKVVY